MPPSTQTGILYQNTERDICLIDIPTSIALAQNRADILLSTLPLESPIPLYEDHTPKTKKAKKNKAQELTDEEQHAEYKTIIEAALIDIHNHFSGSWCAPRALLNHEPNQGKGSMEVDNLEKGLENRLREWAALDESKGYDDAFNFQKMMASLSAPPEGTSDATSSETVAQKWRMSYEPACGVGTKVTSSVTRQESIEPWTSVSHNPEGHAVSLTIFEGRSQSLPGGQEYRFTVPPRSTFFLSDSTHSDNFRASFREITDDFTLPRHFDLILLDPPWPNRSAKRKGAYEQVGGMPYLKKMLLKMDIDSYLEHNALVGVWITNKKSLRGQVLGPGGLFEKWNVGLIEEWIWVKVTTKGEPMFDIDNPMRKPYEVLLLGRAAPNSWTTMAPAPTIKKRVIAAVPDVHSRKPCLKELLESYVPDKKDYSALEIFSRYLVAGWMSWGNEVLKFNWDRYWASRIDSKASNASISSIASNLGDT